jgi:hypothetical protein
MRGLSDKLVFVPGRNRIAFVWVWRSLEHGSEWNERNQPMGADAFAGIRVG